jgi:DNA-binding MltR family transcriptional regulator
MSSDNHDRAFGKVIAGKDIERYLDLHQMQFEFAKLFDYAEPNDRSVAIVGPAYLDLLLRELLVNFLVPDEKEVVKLLHPEGPFGAFGSRVTACYCLGLIGPKIKSDLRLVGKIRNKFAHDLRATFVDADVSSWCKALEWHKDLMMSNPPDGATVRDLFQVGVNCLVMHIHGLVGLARSDRRSSRYP